MARPRKPGTTRTTRANAGAKLKSEASKTGAVEDAEIVEETEKKATEASVTEGAEEKATKTEATEPDTTDADTEASDKAATDGDAAQADEPAAAAEPDPKMAGKAKDDGEEPNPEEPASRRSDPPQPVALVPAPPPRASFVPMALGGVIAAAMGAGALYYATTNGWVDLGGADLAPLETTIGAQGTEITGLQTKLAAAQSEIETMRGTGAAIDAANGKIDDLTTVVDGISKATVALGGQLEDTNERLAEVATQPIPEARLPEKVTNAYEAKFAEFAAALQKEQDTKLAALEARLTTSLEEIAALQSTALQAEQAAMDAASAAKTRAALAEIDVALDTGTSFAAALDALAEAGGPAVPDALATTADGSAWTLATLQSSFPDAARAALVASTRAAAEDGSVDGLTAFFRTQLGVRSLEPREGSDPDAVLSRAEAAVGSGDLEAALAEFGALPEAGQAALSDWISAAQTRIEAKAALAALTNQLNTN